MRHIPLKPLPRHGFTLVELLIVVVLVSILTALVIPAAAPSAYDQLQTAAQILAADLDYGRSLAVRNNSTYRFTFDLPSNRYVLEHTGANPALDALPQTPLRSPDDPPDQQIARLDKLPGLVPQTVRLAAVGTLGQTPAPTTQIEFGPLGSTSVIEESVIWLAANSGASQRFISVRVDPITGMSWVEAFGAVGPPAGIVTGGS